MALELKPEKFEKLIYNRKIADRDIFIVYELNLFM